MTSGPERIGVVAHYNLLERLEPAGPGELYRARDTRHGRTVIVRLMPRSFARDQDARRKLRDQTRDLIALSHPNITTLFDVGEHEGRLYFAFEYLRGVPLRAEMGGGPMNVRRAIELAIQIADALAEAHAAGFVHGGLSPDSIVVTAKGKIKIPAFGLAARAGFEPGDDEARLRDYDSPEEAGGRPPDDVSDIYSAGAVLYEMLAARRPNPKGSPAPSAVNPHVPKEIDEVVLKAVAPEPGLRYQTAVTLSAELRSVGAIMDVRGGAGDEEEPVGGDGSGVPVGLLVAVVVIVIAAALWLLT
jgi:serine/threonine-protein kinase